MDLISLTQTLLQFESITPKDEGCLDFIEFFLKGLGAECHRLPCHDVDNLYAKIGYGPKVFCFAGHTDVVPPGDLTRWSVPPFSGHCHSEALYGRGAVDMKGAIGAFLKALYDVVTGPGIPKGWAIAVMLTSDEEGPALYGTQHILKWLHQNQKPLDLCLVGEPTNNAYIGDTVKIGRRGSLNIHLTVDGLGGHVAYPKAARNPIPALLTYLNVLFENPLDSGTDEFPPSNLEITSIDVGNPTTNVIPNQASARMNVRFNPLHSGESLKHWFYEKLKPIQQKFGTAYTFTLNMDVSSEPFMTRDAKLESLISDAIQSVTGQQPDLSTSGGTSDARFIQKMCPVVEFGLINKTAHQPDEHVMIDDLNLLKDIYEAIIKNLGS